MDPKPDRSLDRVLHRQRKHAIDMVTFCVLDKKERALALSQLLFVSQFSKAGLENMRTPG
jgi:hypothetical protein